MVLTSIHTFIARMTAAALALSYSAAFAGFQVSGTELLDDNGSPFVMRGINHPHAWYAHTTQQALGDIANTGANTVRVVLSNGTHGEGWIKTDRSQLSSIINQCKSHQLVCMLEVHDTTGFGEKAGATEVSRAADYFVEMASTLQGEENYILINIANEPFGNGAEGQWVEAHKNAIAKLRNAGLTHTLVVDAPNWGQDHTFTMLNNAVDVFGSDALGNVMFSVHMYQVYKNRSTISSYLTSFKAKNLALVVGEFGHKHGEGADNDVDEAAVMELCEQLDIGYIGWSWSGNGGGVEFLDIVKNFNASSLTEWGQILINGSNGIRNTATRASVYTGIVGGSSSSSSSSASSSGSQCALNGIRYCEFGDLTDEQEGVYDGWGWENEQSCIVAGGQADPGPGMCPGNGSSASSSGYPSSSTSSSSTSNSSSSTSNSSTSSASSSSAASSSSSSGNASGGSSAGAIGPYSGLAGFMVILGGWALGRRGRQLWCKQLA